jgi:hypothetical protein
MKNLKYAFDLPQVTDKLHDQNPSHFKWISYVKSIFDDTSLSFIWNDQIRIPMERNVLKKLDIF